MVHSLPHPKLGAVYSRSGIYLDTPESGSVLLGRGY
jgi:hypothetical protein